MNVSIPSSSTRSPAGSRLRSRSSTSGSASTSTCSNAITLQSPGRRFENPVVQEAIEGRVEYLESKADRLYSFEIYFTVLYEGWRHRRSRLERLSHLFSNPKLGLRELLSGEQQVVLLEAELDRHREALTNRVNSFLIQLRDVADFSLLPKQECFQFFRRLVNFTPHKAEAVSLNTTSSSTTSSATSHWNATATICASATGS